MVKLKILTHGGETYETEVEVYDHVELHSQTNNTELNTVLIGDIIVSRINIKDVVPIREVDEQS